MLYAIIAIVVIAVAAVAVGVSTLSLGGGNNANVTSLKYIETVASSEAVSLTETISVKNIGSSNMIMLIETSLGKQVVDFGQEKVWIQTLGEWSEGTASGFNTLEEQWNQVWSRFQDQGGNSDITFKIKSVSFTVTDIQVNPTLSDSLFEHD
jgi:oligoendopeptidase F